MKKTSTLRAPFLKRIALIPDKIARDRFPFNTLPFLSDDFSLSFARQFTIFVGENGSGKSTLLEAIAHAAGFHPQGGGSEHQNLGEYASSDDGLARALRCAWLPKVTNGLFFRAESFFNVASYLDREGSSDRWGGKKFHLQSHGEAFMAMLEHRITDQRNVFCVLDEPEAALSPSRQIEFLKLMRGWEEAGNVQAILVTHAPLLMAYPGATLFDFSGGQIRDVAFEDTEHFRLMQSFFADPQAYIGSVLGTE